MPSFVTHYNTRRAHMERDHLPPIRDVPEDVEKADDGSDRGEVLRRWAREIVRAEGELALLHDNNAANHSSVFTDSLAGESALTDDPSPTD